MNKIILSAAIVGLTLASERSKTVDAINKVGGYIVHHQEEIEHTIKNGIGVVKLIEEIAGGNKHRPMFKPTDEVPIETNVDEELFSVKDAAKKVGGAAKAAGGFVVKHQSQIEGAINTGINVAKFVGEIAGDEIEDEELFSVKDAAKKVGGAAKAAGSFIVKHQDEIEKGINTGIAVGRVIAMIAADSEEVADEELFNLKKVVKNVGNAAEKAGKFVAKHHEEIEDAAKVIGYIAGDEIEDEELFSVKDAAKKVGGAAKAAGGFVVKHQSQIEGAINTGINVAKFVGQIAGDEIEDEELFSVKDAAKKVGGAAKAAGGFVVKHQKEIEGAINTGINVARFVGQIAGDGVEVADEELFNIKKVAKNVGNAAKKVGKFVVKHHKEIEDVVKVIGYVAADEIEPSEKEFLGF